MLKLGVQPERINTVTDFEAAKKCSVRAKGGMDTDTPTAAVLAEPVSMISEGTRELPIGRVYPLEQLKEAYRELEQRHTHSKIVLEP